MDAAELRVGDVLMLKSGGHARIAKLAVRRVREVVHNLHVDGLHSYAVGSTEVLVHNNGGSGGETSRLQQRIDQLRDEIAELERKTDSIRLDRPGYGPHDTSGSEQYLVTLISELAELLASGGSP